jgi:adenosine deaminase
MKGAVEMPHPPLEREPIRVMPKVELHVHVEACMTGQRMVKLADELRVPVPRPIDELISFTSLPIFLEAFEWWCSLLRTPEAAEQLAYDAAADMAKEGIVYAELLMGPKYWSRMTYQESIPALARGFDRASAEGLTDCAIVPSISREQSARWAMDLVNWIQDTALPRVVGIGLDGNEAETGRTCPKFSHVYNRAHEVGLGRTVHAGESSGSEGVADALEYLEVDRIDHGVRAVENPTVVRALVDKQVTLNICATSNVLIGLYADLESHPIRELVVAGVPVTVNTDDPAVMDIHLSDEIASVGTAMNWTMAEVVKAQHAAITAAFCSDKRKEELRKQLDAYVTDAFADATAGSSLG